MKRLIKDLLEFGIINIDKPSGPTSFTISDFVRNSLKMRKTSHFGTLDPKVTGVLPIALNRACKLTGFFIGEDKEYVGIMRFHEEVSLEKIEKAIEKDFLGDIQQLPPKRSKVKRQIRQRSIYSFKILEVKNKDFLFKVKCQGGTYIRKLVHDLGNHLGVGAHMLELRRTKAGIFSEHDKKYPSINLYDLEKAVKAYKEGNPKLLSKIIIPAEIVSNVYPRIDLKKKYIDRVLNGIPLEQKFLRKEAEFNEDEIISAFSEDNFIGMYKVINKDKIFARALFIKR